MGVGAGNRCPSTFATKEVDRNPFTDPEIAAGYEAWYQTTGRRADRLEKQLLGRLLDDFPSAYTLLEAGCGTGHFTRWFKEQALQGVGLDLALPMLTETVSLDGVSYVCGDAHALPFPDEAFDLVALITTLEFIDDPVRVLREALRIARQGLILGVLNRHSPLGWQRKREGGTVWGAARFFTPAELIGLIHQVAMQPVRITWQTTLWPLWSGPLPLPWGGFIGIAVQVGLEAGGDR
jgi:ubiquinone/menaquinone biosynthesis C-methylase UbiE